MILKEFFVYDDGMARVLLHTKTNDHSFSYFSNLAAEAQKDFPGLDPGNIKIRQYGVYGIPRTWGVEINIHSEKIPKEYNRLFSYMSLPVPT